MYYFERDKRQFQSKRLQISLFNYLYSIDLPKKDCMDFSKIGQFTQKHSCRKQYKRERNEIVPVLPTIGRYISRKNYHIMFELSLRFC